MTQLLETLEADPALGHVFQDLRKNGVKAALTYCNEELMMDISETVRKYFQEWEMLLQKLETLPFPLHEAAKEKDHRVLLELLERRKRANAANAAQGFDVDGEDAEGISALGYAVWAGHLAATKVLIEYGADPYAVDSCGNTCVHYAAGYGHPELLEYLLEFGFSMHRGNAAGLTPMEVAVQSKQESTIHVLETFGV